MTCGKNDEQFRAVIPRGFEFYKSIGTKSMKIGALAVTPLDANHSIAKVHWEANYKKKDGAGITTGFDVFYFLQDIDGVSKIFAYITGDEEKFYEENGLNPG